MLKDYDRIILFLKRELFYLKTTISSGVASFVTTNFPPFHRADKAKRFWSKRTEILSFSGFTDLNRAVQLEV